MSIRIDEENLINFNTQNRVEKQEKQEKARESVSAKDTFLEKSRQDPVTQKREQAREQAFKLVSEAWKKDEQKTDSLSKLGNDKETLARRKEELMARIKDNSDKREQLKAEYGVSEDSDEQKDLELLEKFQDYSNGSRIDNFSKEEIDRLKDISEKPKTEYQQRMLELNENIGQSRLEQERVEMELEKSSDEYIRRKIENLKTDPMRDANEAVEKIKEKERHEIIGIIREEGVRHLDESEDKKEDAAVKKPENEKGSEKFYEEVQKQLTKILKENAMLDEDLKGIKINTTFEG